MKTRTLPPAQGQHLTQGALELMARATAEQHRAVIELQSLFAKHGGELSTHWLTVKRPEREIRELEETRSFAVINFSAVTVQLGWGGRSATPGNAMPLAPSSWLQLPLATNVATLSASLTDLEGEGQAMVAFIRYRHLMGLAGGTLAATSTGGGSAVATAVTEESPGSVNVEVASGMVLPANPLRKGLNIQNTGAVTVSLGLGHAAVLEHDLRLSPEGSWDGLISNALWRGAVNAIAAAPGSLAVVEV